MKNIKVITDKDFGLDIIEFNNPKIRIGARGIVFNSDNKIAILNNQKKNEYKLVGGGVEEDEDPKFAFEREVLEEAGCKVEIDDFIGTIREEKSQDNFIQTSYVYIAHVLEDTKQLNLTQKEVDEGSKLIWLNIDDAIKFIKECESNLKPSKYGNVYHTKFIVKRDYSILQYYKDHYLK